MNKLYNAVHKTRLDFIFGVKSNLQMESSTRINIAMWCIKQD